MNLKEPFETFIPQGKDSKGRIVGYVVGLRESADDAQCYAWVQRSIKTADGWKDFGAPQRSKLFPTLEAAKAWAYATAKERAAR